MDAQQIAALEAVVGRQLSAEEQATLAPLVLSRNDVAVAAQLSVGRVTHGPTQIGEGTVVAVMGDPRGGLFLDAVIELGSQDRTVYWGMAPVRRGVLDLSIPAARASLESLKAKLPEYAADIEALLSVGVVPDPVHFSIVSDALNRVDGGMTS